ncbi:trehalose-phosphatase [Batrachochytrium salamandrivorans]|nr:trehalose-phosphatase [Batrachochytrium salamandrivorans]
MSTFPSLSLDVTAGAGITSPIFSPSTTQSSSTDSLARGAKHIYVTFEVTANTGFGENVHVVIVEEINSIDHALLTSPDLYPLHCTEKPIPIRAGQKVFYRYCKYSAGKFAMFEHRSEFRMLNLMDPGLGATLVVQDVIENEEFSFENLSASQSGDDGEKQSKWPLLQQQTPALPSSMSSLPPTPSSRSSTTIGSNSTAGGTATTAASAEVFLSPQDYVLVVSFYLPCKLFKLESTGEWRVEMDENSILFHSPPLTSKYMLDKVKAKYVGVPPTGGIPILSQERDAVTAALAPYSCIPVFLDDKTHIEALEYCEGTLRNVFHGFVDVYAKIPTKWWNSNDQKEHYKSYLSCGNQFADTISLNYYENRTIVWFHGHELAPALPFLARKLHATTRRFGLTMHSPFPSSEIFRTLSVRNDLLRAMLTADVITFHLFEYVRHFATCVRRVLGIEEEQNVPGHVELTVDGRIVALVANHGGLDTHRIPHITPQSPSPNDKKITLVSLDYGGFMNGIRLKLLAFERLKHKRPTLPIFFLQHVVEGNWPGPGGSFGMKPQANLDDDEDEMRACIELGRPYTRSAWGKAQCEVICRRINLEFGQGVALVTVLPAMPTIQQRLEFFALGDIFFQAPVKEGVSYTPFEFLLANEGKWNLSTGCHYVEKDEVLVQKSRCMPHRMSSNGIEQIVPSEVSDPVPVLVCSQFSSHVLVLRGSIRVNPYQVGSVLEGLEQALDMGREERIARFRSNLFSARYRTLTRWAEFVLTKIKQVSMRNVHTGSDIVFGFTTSTRIVRPLQNKLPLEKVVKSFNESKQRRLLLLDYGGTTVGDGDGSSTFALRPKGSVLYPTLEMCNALERLSSLPHTDVYILSGRTRADLAEAFKSCGPRLGLVAEHASHIRHPSGVLGGPWERTLGDFEMKAWMKLATNLMQVYTSRTNGTFVEIKESMVLWQYRDADPDFGNTQAKELQQNLQHVLSRFGVDVVKGKGYVEVRTAGCDKGFASKLLFLDHKYDFVLCMGDDAADEPMFTYFESLVKPPELQIWSCGVSIQDTTNAKYNVEDVPAVLHVLETLHKNFGRNQASVLDFANLSAGRHKSVSMSNLQQLSSQQQATASDDNNDGEREKEPTTRVAFGNLEDLAEDGAFGEGDGEEDYGYGSSEEDGAWYFGN